ncbi:MAG: hypothetical protein M3O61_18880, partial [Gemmatimonadota bacterium]|nr:hypothetical protein [Gemmatimonadota bacterium]
RVPLGGPHTQRRRLALLAYLAASDPAVIARHKLIALLWPESDEGIGRHSLSQLLYALRHDLGAHVLRVDQETVSLDPAILESDVHVFDVALRAGQLGQAVDQYRGAFLDGFHVDDAPEMERWIDSERARRATQCALSLDRLAADAEGRGDWHRAHEWWHRRAVLDPTDGRVALRLMHSLVAIGDRRGALEAARVYETLVREDLDAEPDRAVTQLVAELRDGKHQPVEGAVPGAARSHTAAGITPSEVSGAHVPVSDPLPIEPIPAPAPTRPTSASTRRTWRWTAVATVVAAILAALAWQQLQLRESGRATPSVSAVVVIGDLGGPDSVLALAVREALRAQLSNTSGVFVTSDLGLRELKTLMRLPLDSSLTPPQLLAVATRAGAHVAVAGSVVPVGAGAQIVVDVLDPGSGRVQGTFAERPLDAPAILTAIERMGRALGAMISRAPRDSSIRALPAVTTASLPALKSYALARQLASRGLRPEALEHGERAVIYDSTFVLAHYLLGDLLWFLDKQEHSEAHLTKAYELIRTVPLREQLAIRARYEQLVRDRPDSALAYWDLLHDASPRDALAYEGRTWALRALGRHEEAAAAADTAMHLEPAAVVPNTNNALYSWLAVGDTANALVVAERVATRNPEAPLEARFYAALQRRDLTAALALADSSSVMSTRAWRRQVAHLARGDVAGARANLDSLRAADMAQYVPRALVNEGWVELALAGDRGAGARYAQEALNWLRGHDLSPPAVARLSERIADLAARSGDEPTVRAVIDLVRQRDRGRALRSYVLAQRTLDAALAYTRGDFTLAAQRAAEARHGVYFWRSLITIVQLESDARM